MYHTASPELSKQTYCDASNYGSVAFMRSAVPNGEYATGSKENRFFPADAQTASHLCLRRVQVGETRNFLSWAIVVGGHAIMGRNCSEHKTTELAKPFAGVVTRWQRPNVDRFARSSHDVVDLQYSLYLAWKIIIWRTPATIKLMGGLRSQPRSHVYAIQSQSYACTCTGIILWRACIAWGLAWEKSVEEMRKRMKSGKQTWLCEIKVAVNVKSINNVIVEYKTVCTFSFLAGGCIAIPLPRSLCQNTKIQMK